MTAVEAIEAADVEGGFDAFVSSRTGALDVANWPAQGRATMRTMSGARLEMDWPASGEAVRKIDDQPIDDEYDLYEAPSIAQAKLGDGRIIFEYDGERLELDFGIDAASPLMPMRCVG
jgi:hypothetical protein